MFEWLGPIIAHWPGLFLPLALERAVTELHAFCAFWLSWIWMSSAGYARWANDSSAACSAAGPASTAAVFCLELASGSAAFFDGAADRVPCEPVEPTASSKAVPVRTSTAKTPSAIRAFFMSIDLLPNSAAGSRHPVRAGERVRPPGSQSKLYRGAATGSAVWLRHPAVVERLVQRGLVDPRVAGDLAQGAAGARRLLDDLGRLVVPDVRVQRGRGRKRQLRVALVVLTVGLDPV